MSIFWFFLSNSWSNSFTKFPSVLLQVHKFFFSMFPQKIKILSSLIPSCHPNLSFKQTKTLPKKNRFHDRRHFSANSEFIIISVFRMPLNKNHRFTSSSNFLTRDEWENCFPNLWVIIGTSHALNIFFFSSIHNLPLDTIRGKAKKLKNPFDWERRECQGEGAGEMEWFIIWRESSSARHL